MPDHPLPGPDLEELLLDTLDCVARAKAGRLQALEEAIEGGGLLKMARQMTLHGDWTVEYVTGLFATAWYTAPSLAILAWVVAFAGFLEMRIRAVRKAEVGRDAESN